MKRDDKNGQFFLIATVIIVALIIALATYINYSRTESYSKIKELKKELEIESSYVLDYGIYNEKDMNNLLEKFATNFSDYVGEDINLYFIYGKEGSLQGLKYEQGTKDTLTVSESGGKATITIEGKEYEFDINAGQSFYYVLSQDINGEKYIATSQNVE